MDVESLVRRARRGEADARDDLARTWLSRVYGVALASTRHPQDAEDVTQEAFVRAFAALPRLRDPARFGPWIVRIVHNAARDLARRPRPMPLGDAAEAIPDSFVREGLDDRTVRAWRDLPESERLVVWLKIVEGMTFRDIADLLGTSKSRVDRRLRKALARLRKEVSRC